MNIKTITPKAFILLIFHFCFSPSLSAQKSLDITGFYEGVRSQYAQSSKSIIKEFTYQYELVQKENKVEGISTIISEEGNFAEVGIRGIVLDNKFYFEEFKMLDQIKGESMSWCYKSGVLDISWQGDQIVLSGETPSYMVYFGIACSGGFTKLSAPQKRETVYQKSGFPLEKNLELSIYPIPAINSTQLSFEIDKESIISIDLLDLNGKVVFTQENKKIGKGSFSQHIDISKLSAGLYIFNIKIDNVLYTKELLKVN